jgi:hypothetical protein
LKFVNVEFLKTQRVSLTKEIEACTQQITQAYGAIRLIDFLIKKEEEAEENIAPVRSEGQGEVKSPSVV